MLEPVPSWIRRQAVTYELLVREEWPSHYWRGPKAELRKSVTEYAVTGCLVLRPGESVQGRWARPVRYESRWADCDTRKSKSSSDLTTGSMFATKRGRLRPGAGVTTRLLPMWQLNSLP